MSDAVVPFLDLSFSSASSSSAPSQNRVRRGGETSYGSPLEKTCFEGRSPTGTSPGVHTPCREVSSSSTTATLKQPSRGVVSPNDKEQEDVGVVVGTPRATASPLTSRAVIPPLALHFRRSLSLGGGGTSHRGGIANTAGGAVSLSSSSLSSSSSSSSRSCEYLRVAPPPKRPFSLSYQHSSSNSTSGEESSFLLPLDTHRSLYKKRSSVSLVSSSTTAVSSPRIIAAVSPRRSSRGGGDRPGLLLLSSSSSSSSLLSLSSSSAACGGRIKGNSLSCANSICCSPRRHLPPLSSYSSSSSGESVETSSSDPSSKTEEKLCNRINLTREQKEIEGVGKSHEERIEDRQSYFFPSSENVSLHSLVSQSLPHSCLDALSSPLSLLSLERCKIEEARDLSHSPSSFSSSSSLPDDLEEEQVQETQQEGGDGDANERGAEEDFVKCVPRRQLTGEAHEEATVKEKDKKSLTTTLEGCVSDHPISTTSLQCLATRGLTNREDRGSLDLPHVSHLSQKKNSHLKSVVTPVGGEKRTSISSSSSSSATSRRGLSLFQPAEDKTSFSPTTEREEQQQQQVPDENDDVDLLDIPSEILVRRSSLSCCQSLAEEEEKVHGPFLQEPLRLPFLECKKLAGRGDDEDEEWIFSTPSVSHESNRVGEDLPQQQEGSYLSLSDKCTRQEDTSSSSASFKKADALIEEEEEELVLPSSPASISGISLVSPSQRKTRGESYDRGRRAEGSAGEDKVEKSSLIDSKEGKREVFDTRGDRISHEEERREKEEEGHFICLFSPSSLSASFLKEQCGSTDASEEREEVCSRGCHSTTLRRRRRLEEEEGVDDVSDRRVFAGRSSHEERLHDRRERAGTGRSSRQTDKEKFGFLVGEQREREKGEKRGDDLIRCTDTSSSKSEKSILWLRTGGPGKEGEVKPGESAKKDQTALEKKEESERRSTDLQEKKEQHEEDSEAYEAEIEVSDQEYFRAEQDQQEDGEASERFFRHFKREAGDDKTSQRDRREAGALDERRDEVSSIVEKVGGREEQRRREGQRDKGPSGQKKEELIEQQIVFLTEEEEKGVSEDRIEKEDEEESHEDQELRVWNEEEDVVEAELELEEEEKTEEEEEDEVCIESSSPSIEEKSPPSSTRAESSSYTFLPPLLLLLFPLSSPHLNNTKHILGLLIVPPPILLLLLHLLLPPLLLLLTPHFPFLLLLQVVLDEFALWGMHSKGWRSTCTVTLIQPLISFSTRTVVVIVILPLLLQEAEEQTVSRGILLLFRRRLLLLISMARRQVKRGEREVQL